MKNYKLAKLLLWPLLGLMASAVQAQEAVQTTPVIRHFVFGADRPGFTTVSATTRYTAAHPFGYDFNTSSDGNGPFYFSVRATEGNYRITAEVTATGADAVFTIKSESRRLAFLQNQLADGATVKKTFIVNIKDRQIAGGGTVKLKSREYDKLDWDDKLTVEFNGERCALRSLTIEPVSNIPTVYLAGNSTVVNQENEPWASWGQMIPAFFTPDVAVANHAESGLALGSFLGSKRLDKVLSVMKPGDYLFIEFGHNDQKEKGPQAGAWKSYTRRLIHFVKAVREKGGIPVIVTSTNRRRFDAEGHVENSLGDFPAAARKVAADFNVPLIDLHRMTAVLYEALGVEQSKKAFVHYPPSTYPGQREALKDNTHFNTYGAYQIAQCVLKGIREALPELAQHIKPGAPTYDPAEPDAVASWNWPESPRKDVTKPDGN